MSAVPLFLVPPGCVSLTHVSMTLIDTDILLFLSFFQQSGVPGFLKDLQKACAGYANYCRKKWMQLMGHWIVCTMATISCPFSVKSIFLLSLWLHGRHLDVGMINPDLYSRWKWHAACCSMMFMRTCAGQAALSKGMLRNQCYSIELYQQTLYPLFCVIKLQSLQGLWGFLGCLQCILYLITPVHYSLREYGPYAAKKDHDNERLQLFAKTFYDFGNCFFLVKFEIL